MYLLSYLLWIVPRGTIRRLSGACCISLQHDAFRRLPAYAGCRADLVV